MNTDVLTLSDCLKFSVRPKTCYFDHRDGTLTAFNSFCKPKKDTFFNEYSIKVPKKDEDVILRDGFQADYYDLRYQFDRAKESFERTFGRVDRCDKSKNKELINNIRDILLESKKRAEKCFDNYFSEQDIDDYIAGREKSRINSLYAKRRRIGRKVFFNKDKFNFFVTVTRDDKLYCSEVLWQKDLLRYFSNLADKKGVRVLGRFERGNKDDRLHFHAFMCVPEGSLRRGFTTVNRFSDVDQRWRTVQESVDFRMRFGMNEFDDLTKKSADDFKRCLNYILKYINKQDEKIYYSRYLPSSCLSFVDIADVYLKGDDVTTKFLLRPDCCLTAEPLYDVNDIHAFGTAELVFA